ncbi:MAG: Hsp70 family protein [Planctomycetota bacterium]
MNEKSIDPEKTVGIDLGTTFSVVAHLDRDQKPTTIPNDEGDLSTPSVIFFDSSGTVVGNEAINAAEFEPARSARYAKRDVGSEIFHKKILGHTFPPEVLQAIVLRKLKDDAELKIGKFSKAVITVPAYFNEPRRKATQDAGTLAGIEVLDIINEPTAAAIAFGVKEGFIDQEGVAEKNERVLVYDLGGGTFDVTLMDISGSEFNTIATAGDVHLGGIDWDLRILDFLADQFQEQHGNDPREDASATLKLRQLATRAKKTLTARDTAQVRFAFENQRSNLEVSRVEFEEITEDLVERTKLTVNRLLREASIKWNDVSRLLLVGGSTRMPMIHTMLEKESGLSVDRSLSPDEAVAHGAAVYADILMRRGRGDDTFKVSNVNSHDLGVLGLDPKTKKAVRQIMIPRNSKIPVIKSRKFVTSKDSQKEVVVTVVEGGTDRGVGATKIGKCRVTELPEGLVKGSPVNVTFKYSSDGRLTVNADLPTADVRARTIIERASGMTRQEVAEWKTRLADGIRIKERFKDSDPDLKQTSAKKTPSPKSDSNGRAGKIEKKTKRTSASEDILDLKIGEKRKSKHDLIDFSLPEIADKNSNGSDSFAGIDLGDAPPKNNDDSFALDEIPGNNSVTSDSGLDSFFDKLKD